MRAWTERRGSGFMSLSSSSSSLWVTCTWLGEAAAVDPRTELKTDDRSRFRTLSCTRERRDGRESSMMPASRALESGRGLCILTIWVLFAPSSKRTLAMRRNQNVRGYGTIDRTKRAVTCIPRQSMSAFKTR